MPDLGISLCPLCGYSLEGLPPPHRCPECGFEYDEHTRVWMAPASRWQHLEYILPLLAIAMIFGTLFPTFYGRMGRTWQLLFIAVAVGCLAVVIRAISRHSDANRRGQCAAVTPRGLFIRNPHGEEWIAWADVGFVYLSPTFDYVTRCTSIQTTPLPSAFKDEDEQKSFAKAVAEAKTFYLEVSPRAST
ncbi:MAG TPA: hypothetical protein VNT79_13555 [Phycisphaerae bacterium]|nr:hypothetical protein [Phycisphaerae bacterium]